LKTFVAGLSIVAIGLHSLENRYKLEGKLLKIYKAQVTEGKGSAGEVIKSGSGVLRIATGRGALDIKELQIEGGKRLEVEEFLRGHKIPEETILGE